MHNTWFQTHAVEEETWGAGKNKGCNKHAHKHEDRHTIHTIHTINMKTGTRRYGCRSRSPFYYQVSLLDYLTPSLNGFLSTNIIKYRDDRAASSESLPPGLKSSKTFSAQRIPAVSAVLQNREKVVCMTIWYLNVRDIPPSHCLMLLFGIFQASAGAAYYCRFFASPRQFWWGHLASPPPITATGKPESFS